MSLFDIKSFAHIVTYIESLYIGYHPVPDAYHEKIYRSKFQQQAQTIIPNPVQQTQRHNQSDVYDE